MYCCWLAFELVFVYIFIVETKNLSLEETAALFDGDAVKDAIGAVMTGMRNEGLITNDEKGPDFLTTVRYEET